MLSVEDYDAAEQRAVEQLPNRIIQCCQPELFQTVGYPTRVRATASLHRYVDVMQETRARVIYDHLLKGVSASEADAITDMATIVAEMSERVYRRRCVPVSALLRALIVVRRALALMPHCTATILEIGSGSGYVAALLARSGHPVIVTDVSQAFYLHQFQLFSSIGRQLIELANDPRSLSEAVAGPTGCIIHVPWWKFYTVGASLFIPIDLITMNHCVCEMHPFALAYVLKTSAAALAQSSEQLRCIIIDGFGSTIMHSREEAESAFFGSGFEAQSDGIVSIFTPNDKQRNELVSRLQTCAFPDQPVSFKTLMKSLTSIAGRNDLRTDDELFLSYIGADAL